MNSFGGRFDQTIGNVHTLMSLDEVMQDVPVYLLSDDSIAFILKPVSNICQLIVVTAHLTMAYMDYVLLSSCLFSVVLF